MHTVLIDHFNRQNRLVPKGSVVEIDAETAKANPALYGPAVKKPEESKDKATLTRIVLERKLATAEEIPGLSYQQIRQLAEKE